MQWLANSVEALFPKAIVKGTAWEQTWEVEQRDLFVRTALFFFPLVALTYIGHFVFYDRVINLEPIEGWFVFRVTAALLAMLCFMYYFRSRNTPTVSKFYKVPALIAVSLLCISQAFIATIHEQASYLFSFIFVVIGVFIMRSSALNSFLLSTALLALQLPLLIQTDDSIQVLFSGAFVTILTSVITRTAYASEVKNFLLTHERDQSKQEMIDLTQEFSNRLRSFIPKVIANRLQNAVDLKGMSVLEASIEVLRPRSKEITCLFSDIRGFTKSSKNLDSFVAKSVLPELKACSDEIENFEGIPRKIGDLVFAYFDDTDTELNVLRSVLAAIRISNLNKDINETLSAERVNRYILIASGEAIVGNVGGYRFVCRNHCSWLFGQFPGTIGRGNQITRTL